MNYPQEFDLSDNPQRIAFCSALASLASQHIGIDVVFDPTLPDDAAEIRLVDNYEMRLVACSAKVYSWFRAEVDQASLPKADKHDVESTSLYYATMHLDDGRVIPSVMSQMGRHLMISADAVAMLVDGGPAPQNIVVYRIDNGANFLKLEDAKRYFPKFRHVLERIASDFRLVLDDEAARN